MPHIPSKPKNDAALLEVIANIIFIAGFRWSVVQSRWPYIKKAFNNFDPKKVATMKDISLMKKEGMIKNQGKITAIIENARIVNSLAKEHGSAMKYFEKMYRKYKKDPLLNESVMENVTRFNRIGKTTSRWLAYVVTRDKTLLKDHEA